MLQWRCDEILGTATVNVENRGVRQAPQSREKAAKEERMSGDASSVLVPLLPYPESPIEGSHASHWRWDGSWVRRGGLVSLRDAGVSRGEERKAVCRQIELS